MENNSEDSNYSRGYRRMVLKIVFDIVLWLAVVLLLLYVYLEVEPYKRGFFCDDVELSYPNKPDTVSNTLLMVGGFVISLSVVWTTEVLNFLDKQCNQQSYCTVGKFVHCVQRYAVFIAGCVLQQLVVELCKNELGVLRPNFFDVCKPDFNRSQCPSYITEYRCTSTANDNIIRDLRKSFPSGHAAFSMYIAIFCCLDVQVHVRVGFSHILRFFVQFGLVMMALLCGISRISDHKHHSDDVTGGFVMGASVAVFVFLLIGKKTEPEYLRLKQDDHCVCALPNRLTCCHGGQQTDEEPQTPAPLLTHQYSNDVMIDMTSPTFIISGGTPKYT